MTTDTIVLASEKNAATSTGSLAETKPVSEEKPLENGEIKPTEGEEPETEESETEDPETEEAEENEEELEAKAKEPKPKKKGGFQKRIDKLNGRISAVEQEREYWRGEALRAKQTEKPVETPVKQDLSKRPKADDFKTADEYTEALIDWKADQKMVQREQKLREESIKTEFQTKANDHAARVKTLSAQKEDWDEVQETFNRIRLSAAVEQLILDAGEYSAGLVYELGKNPDELDKLCKMSYGQAARTLGKIEARLDKPSTPSKEQKTTKAPKPVTPVRTKGSSIQKGYRPDMSQKEFEAWRNEQLKR